MKKIIFGLLLASQIAFTQAQAADQSVPESSAPVAIPFSLGTYLIGRRNATPQYTRVELRISDADQSWEISLIKKDGTVEVIKLEEYENLGRGHSVFRKITITEGKITTGSELFAYIPAFTDKIQIDLCLKTNEHTRRRVILKP
ncbi:MAG: hypothetical protein LBJ31_08460 [Treponema sp.]|jgi:hypothetical protein|nr:hypothetical protein [Treponema sp.]